MGKKYEGVYIGLAELVLELSERPTMEDKGAFIDQVVKCLVRQTRGINSYADSLMDATDEYRAENARRQREYRDRQKGKAEDPTEVKDEQAPMAEEPKPARKPREKKTDAIDDPEKAAFGQFKNVYLTDAENAKLKEKYGEKYDYAMEILSSYKKSSGKTYKSDFAAFFSWVDKRINEDNAANNIRSFKQMDKDEAARRARESFPGIMEKYGLQ